MEPSLDILLLGGGGREHALAWQLSRSRRCGTLHAAPGNPGIAQLARCVPGLDPSDADAVVDWAKAHDIGLVVVGPEAPLVAGVADALGRAGIACFGPSQAAARLEASKTFTKALCDRAGIPTARHRSFTDLADALAHVAEQPLPVVVKADGLAQGKGVVVAHDRDAATAAVRRLLAEESSRIVVEEFLDGEEASFFVLSDGRTALPLIAAQDHKQAHDGDRGPNTGGMGAYAPAPSFTAAVEAEVMARIIQPTLATLAADGTPFVGVLFAGLMLTASGPKLIEYNVRFGDPECQALMMLLACDLGDLLLACAQGRLADQAVRWRAGAAACVVVAARGYPGTPATGGRIEGLDEAEAGGVRIFHAGTARDRDGHLVAAGGRVLSVCAAGPGVGQAVRQAYGAIERISFADGCWRTDIGHRAIAREREQDG